MTAIYLDNNATTRTDPRVVETMLPYFCAEYGNPSSMHSRGGEAQSAVRLARGQVQRLIGAAEPAEIIFTSGGTESDNLAILSALEVSGERREIVVSAVEHPAVLSLCAWLERSRGCRVHVIPVDTLGHLDVSAYERALSDRVAVVSIMWANNETGVIFPAADLAETAKAVGALFHTDAVQAAGRVPLNLKSSAIDMASLSGHKIHAPMGVGALYVKRGAPFQAQQHGGRQEGGRRGGTENVPGVVALGKAAELALESMSEETVRVRMLRDHLEQGLTARVGGCLVVGDRERRLANTSNIAFAGVEGEDVVLLLDKAGVAVSLGSACAAGSFEPSHVLKAMHVPETALRGGIRFSLSRDTTLGEIERALEIVPEVIARLRGHAEEAAPQALASAHA